MERRQIAVGIGSTLLAGGLGMIATWASMSTSSVMLGAGGVVCASLGAFTLAWLWWTSPNEATAMSGNGPKNVNTGINNGIVGDVTGPVHIGKMPVVFTDEMALSALARCAPGLPVRVRAIGSEKAVPLAMAFKHLLEQRRFVVLMDRVCSKTPAPTEPISVENRPTETVVTIFPDL